MAKLRNTEKLDDKSAKSSGIKTTTIKSKRISAAKSSIKISSRSKVSKTSKAAKKPLSEMNWLKGLASKETSVEQKHLESGIKGIRTRPQSSLRFRNENNCEYAMFPWNKGHCSGYIKMHPLGEKERSKTTTRMHLFVLLGTVQLLVGGVAKDFNTGSSITIPKGMYYGLKNPTSEETVLRFQSTSVDQ